MHIQNVQVFQSGFNRNVPPDGPPLVRYTSDFRRPLRKVRICPSWSYLGCSWVEYYPAVLFCTPSGKIDRSNFREMDPHFMTDKISLAGVHKIRARRLPVPLQQSHGSPKSTPLPRHQKQLTSVLSPSSQIANRWISFFINCCRLSDCHACCKLSTGLG